MGSRCSEIVGRTVHQVGISRNALVVEQIDESGATAVYRQWDAGTLLEPESRALRGRGAPSHAGHDRRRVPGSAGRDALHYAGVAGNDPAIAHDEDEVGATVRRAPDAEYGGTDTGTSCRARTGPPSTSSPLRPTGLANNVLRSPSPCVWSPRQSARPVHVTSTGRW